MVQDAQSHSEHLYEEPGIVMTDEVKYCAQCARDRWISDFPSTKTGPRAGKPRAWCKECERAYGREKYAKNKPAQQERAKRKHLRRKFNLTPEELEGKRKEQDNKCAICSTEFTKTPQIDHNHATGVLHKLLCAPCNWGLGCFRDNPKLLLEAVRYLRANQ